MKLSYQRLIGLDVLRGIAIVLMIVYHFCFDLNYFGYINIDMFQGLIWKLFRYLIITLFLLSVGISLVLAHATGINWHQVFKRFWQLSLAASAVSVGSYLQFPDTWIYFGILHFIALTSIISLPFLHQQKWAIIVSIIIFIGYFGDILHFQWLEPLLHTSLNLPYATEDLVSIFPWWGVILLGIAFASSRQYVKFINHQGWQALPASRLLSLLGRHSLWVYLIHQPILFGLFFLVV